MWNQPISDGQITSCAVASRPFNLFPNEKRDFSLCLIAFADNAMKAQISIYELTDSLFTKLAVQPTGLNNFVLIAGNPNVPATGLTETAPYNWQDIRVFSTIFTAQSSSAVEKKDLKIVVSFEATNYLPSTANKINPAGLQFIVDIYTGF